MSLLPAVDRVVSGLDRDVPVWDFRTANDRLSEFLALPRFRTVLLSIFAGLALLLAAIGIYGVLSQAVTERRHEIGIRMAVGAKQRDVLRLVVRQAFMLAIAGVVLGAGAAWALTRFLTAFLYGVRPTDAATFALVSALLLTVALVASYAPARWAAKTEPMVALRSE
jgi:putative ABC transport system permease protein